MSSEESSTSLRCGQNCASFVCVLFEGKGLYFTSQEHEKDNKGVSAAKFHQTIILMLMYILQYPVQYFKEFFSPPFLMIAISLEDIFKRRGGGERESYVRSIRQKTLRKQ